MPLGYLFALLKLLSNRLLKKKKRVVRIICFRLGAINMSWENFIGAQCNMKEEVFLAALNAS